MGHCHRSAAVRLRLQSQIAGCVDILGIRTKRLTGTDPRCTERADGLHKCVRAGRTGVSLSGLRVWRWKPYEESSEVSQKMMMPTLELPLVCAVEAPGSSQANSFGFARLRTRGGRGVFALVVGACVSTVYDVCSVIMTYLLRGIIDGSARPLC